MAAKRPSKDGSRRKKRAEERGADLDGKARETLIEWLRGWVWINSHREAWTAMAAETAKESRGSRAWAADRLRMLERGAHELATGNIKRPIVSLRALLRRLGRDDRDWAAIEAVAELQQAYDPRKKYMTDYTAVASESDALLNLWMIRHGETGGELTRIETAAKADIGRAIAAAKGKRGRAQAIAAVAVIDGRKPETIADLYEDMLAHARGALLPD